MLLGRVWSQRRMDRLGGGSHFLLILFLGWAFWGPCSEVKMAVSKPRREASEQASSADTFASAPELVVPGVLGSGSTWRTRRS